MRAQRVDGARKVAFVRLWDLEGVGNVIFGNGELNTKERIS